MRSSKIQIVDNGGCTRAVHYLNAGLTRLATKKSAVVRSHQYNLAYCPVELVDQQLDYICKMDVLIGVCSNTLRDGGIRLRRRRRKWTDGEAVVIHSAHPPRFSAHVSLAPVARRVLREHGHGACVVYFSGAVGLLTDFPPRTLFHTSKQAWEGDYQPLINCIVQSVQASLTDVERIMA
ncbi:hypothetical protein JVT61DRAFT_508 [Boletus reticuloceps]|uniref:Uncharacterized protein n=1 Tax=Boletus reticuloceps TaxID=495285 RepID=A0A8I3AGT9_9AGAM|nr:hypothetical protein JVT61DRAFT_508 [Boletus reticuloceps]